MAIVSEQGPVAVVVGTVPTVPVLALADLTAVMPSIPDYVAAQVEAARRDPVLCIEPMTHGDARYAEGRRAGLREAAADLEAVAERLSEHGPISRMFSLAYHSEAENLRAKAGEP